MEQCGSSELSSEAFPSINHSSTTTFRQKFKRFLSFCGPGYLIAVGYIDPGNWVTDIEAGSHYGYSLLWVILLSNIMAMLLQHLCIRLGVRTGLDLAQACRVHCGKWTNLGLYVLAEVAIVACDLSDVLGTAIAFKLLFGLPLVYGMILTTLDVLALLGGLASANSHYKLLESVVISLMSIVGGCFIIELFMVKPKWDQVLLGFVPRSTAIFSDSQALFTALAIIGATVMPHNLYLHSSIVKYRMKSDETMEDNNNISEDEIATPISALDDAILTDPKREATLATIIRYSTYDSIVALFLALLINGAILVVASAAFHDRGKFNVSHIEEAASLMASWLGPVSVYIFGFALLAAGQSSTVTGTLAGQIIFEGFLKLRLRPWLRRLLTRATAIVPALIIIVVAGPDSVSRLLIYSQVILSFQLPFAVVPLIFFTFAAERAHDRAVERVLNQTGTSLSKMHEPTNPTEALANDSPYKNNIANETVAILIDRDQSRILPKRRPRWHMQVLEASAWIVATLIICFNLLFTFCSFRDGS